MAAKSVADALDLTREQILLVELAQGAEDARLFFQDRAAACLGRMRGHDQPHLRALQQRGHISPAHSALFQQLDRLADRATPGRGKRLRFAPADAAHALVVLGEIDELEIAGERANQQHRLVDAESRDRRRKLDARFRIAGAVRLGQSANGLLPRSNASMPACAVMTSPSRSPRK